MVDVQAVINSVRGERLLCRTGALILHNLWLGRETEIAARFNFKAINYVEWKIEQLEKGQRRINFSWETVICDLNMISELPAQTDTLLIYNIDIALSFLSTKDVQRVWRSLREGFPHRPKGLLLTIPKDASDVHPDFEELKQWERDGRLAQLN